MEDKIKCDQCDAEFETSNQLRGHMMSHKSRNKDRKKRIPVGERRFRMSVDFEIPGKKLRWFNDNWRRDPLRIQKALDGGYEFVTRDRVTVGEGVDRNSNLGTLVSAPVGSNSDGTPITGFLMAIDEEFYEEDQKAKEKIVDDIDANIKRGTNQNTLGHDGYVDKIQYDPGGH